MASDTGAIADHLGAEPIHAVELVERLDDGVLVHLAAAIRDEQRRRAIDHGDHEAIIAQAFEVGFGRDGLGVLPWVEGSLIVCPGAIVSSSRTSHRCRFVSVDDTWIWESAHLIDEVKRSSPGAADGFRAVALLPIVEGLELDVVSGRARRGQHRVERVVSYEVRRAQLVEVAQRTVAPAGMA